MDWPEWIGKSGSTQTRCNPCASSIYPERLNLTKDEHVMKWKAGHYAEEAPSIYRGDSDVFAQWSVDRFNGLCCGPFKMKNEIRIHNWGVICTIISVLLLLLFSSWLCQLYLFFLGSSCFLCTWSTVLILVFLSSDLIQFYMAKGCSMLHCDKCEIITNYKTLSAVSEQKLFHGMSGFFDIWGTVIERNQNQKTFDPSSHFVTNTSRVQCTTCMCLF